MPLRKESDYRSMAHHVTALPCRHVGCFLIVENRGDDGCGGVLDAVEQALADHSPGCRAFRSALTPATTRRGGQRLVDRLDSS